MRRLDSESPQQSPPRMHYHRTCSTPPCPLVSYPCAMMAWPGPTRSAILNLRPHPTEPDPICVPSPSGHARLAIHLWHRCTYLVRPLALQAVCPVQPHCFLFIDVRVPHVRPPHAKCTRAPRPRCSAARPPVRASPCSCAAWLPCATPRAPHACSTTSRGSNRTGSSAPMPACNYASRSHCFYPRLHPCDRAACAGSLPHTIHVPTCACSAPEARACAACCPSESRACASWSCGRNARPPTRLSASLSSLISSHACMHEQR
jgi:hypothetical protein